jgi:hypothetical protein
LWCLTKQSVMWGNCDRLQYKIKSFLL